MSDEEFERKVREIFDRAKRMLEGHEKGKRDTIINAALDLEALGIPPDEIGLLLVEYLPSLSKSYIYECIDKKYKPKQKKLSKTQSASGLSDDKKVLEEEKKEPIAIDTQGNPILEEEEEEEEEDRRSESQISDQVNASLKAAGPQEEEPMWYRMDRGGLLNFVEGLLEENAKKNKRTHELEDQNRDFFEEIEQLKKNKEPDQNQKQKDSIIDMQEKTIKQLRNETAELKQALAERQAFKAASEITPQEDLVSENKALRAENEVLKKQRQLNLEPSPVIMDCSKFDMFTYRKSKIKIIHDGERVTQVIPIKRAGEVNS